ncbi:MAG: glycosyltransferase [Selenomonadaceae bacterium]|nr:glycosyltransferase [Selenomonadaceae bacterium]
MEKKSPKVSVILTSYNHAAYVEEAIESVLRQTFTDFELLIIDDGSTDNSREIIKSFNDPRIKTFLYEENRGPVLAIREAVNSARGKYIAVHHSDDLWAINKLEKQVAFLDANENFAACFTLVDFVDEEGYLRELEDNDFYKNVFEKSNRSRAEWLNYFFYNGNCLCHPSAMVRREAYDKYRLLDVHGFWQLPDYLMWIRLCFHADIFILQERLTKFRLRRARQENTSATSYDKLVRADLEFYFIAREFVYNFTDNKFFLDVFPEAKKFCVGGQINRRFAFAKICLEKKVAAFNLVGLELLKELLNSPANAAEIKTLYNYDEKTFLSDGGTFDVFNLTQKNNMLRAEIFVGNGEEFTLVAKKIINVDPTKNFYVRMEFNISRPIKYLRFDPDGNFISLKVNRVLINGKLCGDFFSNVGEIVNGFHRFWTSDPQIIFDVKELSGHVTFEIFGKLEDNYPAILEQTLKKFSKENETFRAQHEALIEENQQLKQFSESILNSNSWKLTKSLRDFRQWLNSDNKEKALTAARFIYKAMPLAEDKKVGLKDKFYKCFAPLLKDTRRYKIWQMSNGFMPRALIQEQSSFVGELLEQPGKIAIQAHIFYLDLLKEMVDACANMPYKFDALISIVEESTANKVQAAFDKIPNAEKVIVRLVPNRGRDVAPFLAGFSDLLPKYDFVAHIHSKKSLYTGNEQQNWRKYLFDALLGEPKRIRKIFKAFKDNKSVGVIYPRPAANVPYVAFTWLSNREVGQQLLSRVNIPPNKLDYFDFPAGTMFWARTTALKKFFQANFTFKDFPPEQGQNDGTIAHAFERSILLAAQSENMIYYEFEPSTETYTINLGSKNLWQYYQRTDAEVRDIVLNQAEIISFDVFDTLLMRCVAKPYHVNEIIRLKVEDLLGKSFDFPNLRVKAEELARQKKGGDVTLDEIYKSFGELTKLNDEICEIIRELEVSTELDLILPREKVVAWFREALRRGKEVWLISDMYLQTPDLERLLRKCGVEGYTKLLISCETGMRKDTAAIWNYLAKQNLNRVGKLIHFGDNEMSDIQLVCDRGFGGYHLMSAINLLSQVPFGRNLLEQSNYKMSLYAGILLGVVLAKKFQDPFRLCNDLTGGSGRLIIKSFRDLGYWFYGIPLLTFMLWLIRKTRLDDINRIFFLARDGYFLQTFYEFITKLLNIEPLPSDYFYSSRRAVSIASIREISQAKRLIRLKFQGTLNHFFKVRFGLDLGDDRKISLPERDSSLVEKIIDEHAEEILQHAENERANYEKYIDNLGGSLNKVGVVDMGYSGTIQYYLQELTGNIFTGYYFATSYTNHFGKDADKRMRGCFTENDDYSRTRSAIYHYQLLFETILTAPDAQLKNFDVQGRPVFGEPEPGQNRFDDIREIHEGIKDFCRDVMAIFGDIILRVPIDKNFVEAWVRAFVNDTKIIASELRGIFTIDDEYCNTFHGNALDFYLGNVKKF